MQISTFVKQITIEVNGEPFLCVDRKYKYSLTDLIQYLNFNTDTTIIEYNQQIIEPKLFSTILLKNNDKIEFITLVGGG
uniref:thiamine biosynthesis protein S n=1 Tax=Dixoniella grisea TaxID=35153 RepID=UPI001FCD1C80|nr:thiamine biosynthesis protein S [Dixoniella grisea]UNJ17090.1 thiamine biosynthesis protein S [Dixoniella grisea]